MIRGISAQLPELFKLKIGSKGEARKTRDGKRTYRLPTKWDYMKICSVERDENDDFIVDKELTKQLGDGSSEPKKIGPIMLLFDDPDLNLWTSYRCYKGRTCVCKGNGEVATRMETKGEGDNCVIVPGGEEEIECGDQCPMLKKGACKPNGILSFVIPDAPLGGVCKFRTTSYNSIKNLYGGLVYLRQLTGGKLRGIPFSLMLNSKDTQVEGRQRTVYYLSIGFDGKVADIRKAAIERGGGEHLALAEGIEADAQKRKALEGEVSPPDANDIEADEFMPEYEQKEDGAIVNKTTGEMEQAPEVEKVEPKFPMNGGDSAGAGSGPEVEEETEAREEKAAKSAGSKAPVKPSKPVSQKELLI